MCGGGIGRRLAGRWASGCTREELPGTAQRPTCGVQIPAHTTKRSVTMCKFCEAGEDIEFTFYDRPVILRLDDEHSDILKVRLPFPYGGAITKPLIINYCFICGKKLGDNYEPTQSTRV